MKSEFSKKIRRAEEWLEKMTYDYEITSAELGAGGEIRVFVDELTPGGGLSDGYFLTVERDGAVLNDAGENVVTVARDAYSNDEDLLQWLDSFEQDDLKEFPTKEELAVLKIWEENRGVSMEDFEDAMESLQNPERDEEEER